VCQNIGSRMDQQWIRRPPASYFSSQIDLLSFTHFQAVFAGSLRVRGLKKETGDCEYSGVRPPDFRSTFVVVPRKCVVDKEGD